MRVCIDSSRRVLHKALEHQLKYFYLQKDSFDDAHIDIIIQDYCRKPAMVKAQTASNRYFYDNGLLDIPAHRLCFDISGKVHKYFLDYFTIPVNLVIQLFIQNQGKTLVHSAGILQNGSALLFPALGGIGKTTIVSHAMKSGGKLYGDDMCIVDKDAMLYAYPIDFSVYNYHYKLLGLEKSFKIKISFAFGRILKLFGKIPVVSSIAARIRAKFFPESENISPLIIYGPNCVANSSKISKITYIGRHYKNDKQFKYEDITNSEMATRLTSVLMLEWRYSVEFLKIYSAFSKGFSYFDMCNRIQETYLSAIRNACVESVSVSASLSNEEYLDVLRDIAIISGGN